MREAKGTFEFFAAIWDHIHKMFPRIFKFTVIIVLHKVTTWVKSKLNSQEQLNRKWPTHPYTKTPKIKPNLNSRSAQTFKAFYAQPRISCSLFRFFKAIFTKLYARHSNRLFVTLGKLGLHQSCQMENLRMM